MERVKPILRFKGPDDTEYSTHDIADEETKATKRIVVLPQQLGPQMFHIAKLNSEGEPITKLNEHVVACLGKELAAMLVEVNTIHEMLKANEVLGVWLFLSPRNIFASLLLILEPYIVYNFEIMDSSPKRNPVDKQGLLVKALRHGEQLLKANFPEVIRAQCLCFLHCWLGHICFWLSLQTHLFSDAQRSQYEYRMRDYFVKATTGDCIAGEAHFALACLYSEECAEKSYEHVLWAKRYHYRDVTEIYEWLHSGSTDKLTSFSLYTMALISVIWERSDQSRLKLELPKWCSQQFLDVLARKPPQSMRVLLKVGVQDFGVLRQLFCVRNLYELQITSMVPLQLNHVAYFALPSLQTLSWHHFLAREQEMAVLHALLLGSPQLVSFDLLFYEQPSFSALVEALNACPSEELQSVTIRRAAPHWTYDRVSPAAWNYFFRNKCRSLKLLELQYVPELTDAALDVPQSLDTLWMDSFCVTSASTVKFEGNFGYVERQGLERLLKSASLTSLTLNLQLMKDNRDLLYPISLALEKNTSLTSFALKFDQKRGAAGKVPPELVTALAKHPALEHLSLHMMSTDCYTYGVYNINYTLELLAAKRTWRTLSVTMRHHPPRKENWLPYPLPDAALFQRAVANLRRSYCLVNFDSILLRWKPELETVASQLKENAERRDRAWLRIGFFMIFMRANRTSPFRESALALLPTFLNFLNFSQRRVSL